ncbi:MAG: ABC transporter ATP-binding protein, partial [Candidatus Thermoplasmatota archaeon]|nr:ABC transporter ATP-binding protein [Candidatus Thermoplasmatota archaeon]
LLLDEPAAGMNEVETDDLLERIREIRAMGKTVLLIEHDMDVVMRHSDTVIAMHQGKVFAEGTPTEIRGNEEVIETYLGT